MKFEQYLREKHWNTSTFSKVWGIELPSLRKIVNKKGSPSLELALYIEKATDGKVSPWDLSPLADEIKKGNWSKLREKKKRNKKHNESEKDSECPRDVET